MEYVWPAALAAADLNWIDFLVGVFLIVLVWRGLQTGLVGGLLSLAVFVAAFWAALTFNEPLGVWIRDQTKLPEGIARVASFVGLLVVARLGLGIPAAQLEAAVHASLRFFRPLDWLNRLTGIIPEVLMGSIAMIAILLALSTMPLSPPVAEAIRASWTGRTVLPSVATAAPLARDFLSALPADQLPLPSLTPRIAAPDERVQLNFPAGLPLTVDQAAEARMLELLNRERTSRELPALQLDPTIVPVARAHSRDMFERSYFSHQTPDGLTPVNRLRQGGVEFLVAGENLAYAPTVERAHEGLMKSPGHRENILRPEFGRVGIGVIR
ncbi:MAG TPA: CvpA family protein, partial [Dehalococcoidia bacterium]|nr:CvpA family protein [Dehalococcoidia bacterium]